jgi:hypothetical protein
MCLRSSGNFVCSEVSCICEQSKGRDALTQERRTLEKTYLFAIMEAAEVEEAEFPPRRPHHRQLRR